MSTLSHVETLLQREVRSLGLIVVVKSATDARVYHQDREVYATGNVAALQAFIDGWRAAKRAA